MPVSGSSRIKFANNIVAGSIQITHCIQNFVINTFVFTAESLRIENFIAVQHYGVFKASAFYQADRLQIINLRFFAKSATGRNLFGKK